MSSRAPLTIEGALYRDPRPSPIDRPLSPTEELRQRRRDMAARDNEELRRLRRATSAIAALYPDRPLRYRRDVPTPEQSSYWLDEELPFNAVGWLIKVIASLRTALAVAATGVIILHRLIAVALQALWESTSDFQKRCMLLEVAPVERTLSPTEASSIAPDDAETRFQLLELD